MAEGRIVKSEAERGLTQNQLVVGTVDRHLGRPVIRQHKLVVVTGVRLVSFPALLTFDVKGADQAVLRDDCLGFRDDLHSVVRRVTFIIHTIRPSYNRKIMDVKL